MNSIIFSAWIKMNYIFTVLCLKRTLFEYLFTTEGKQMTNRVFCLAATWFYYKWMNAVFIMALSEVGHDIFLFTVYKATYSILISALVLRLPSNHHFTKVWKTFQPLNCSPVLTCCLVGLVIQLVSRFSVRSYEHKVCKSVWTLCAPKEATSAATPLC